MHVISKQERKEIHDETKHLTRPVLIVLAITVMAIIGWNFAMRAIYQHFKEPPNVTDPR